MHKTTPTLWICLYETNIANKPHTASIATRKKAVSQPSQNSCHLFGEYEIQ